MRKVLLNCIAAVALFAIAALSLRSHSAAMPSSEVVVRLAELQIAPEKLDAYKQLLREEIDTSIRTEPGVLMLYAVGIRGAPNQIRMTEVYADRQAYQAHISSAHFQKYKIGTAAMVRSLILHETDPIRLGDRKGW